MVLYGSMWRAYSLLSELGRSLNRNSRPGREFPTAGNVTPEVRAAPRGDTASCVSQSPSMAPSPDRFDAVFRQALPPVLGGLLDPQILATRWTWPSALPAMSTGALACHLVSQIRHARDLLARPSTLPLLPGGVDEHYARAAWVRAQCPTDPVNDRSNSDAEAEHGVELLRADATAAIAEVRDLLASGRAGATTDIPWQGWALRRDDFLLTRMLELVVHGEDLALSLDLPAPPFPEQVFVPVVELPARLAVHRHGRSAVISSLTRDERAQPISAF